MNNAAVRNAIHVPEQEFYGGPWPSRGMHYSTYTHASLDLYPSLLAKYRIVICAHTIPATATATTAAATADHPK